MTLMAKAGPRARREVHQEVDSVDRLMRVLDEIRGVLGLSKAELARRVDTHPAAVRRMLSVEAPNPTFATVVKLVDAVGLKLQLVPKDAPADDELWRAWQARKQASYDADQRALKSGKATRAQLTRANSVVPEGAAKEPLPWDQVLR